MTPRLLLTLALTLGLSTTAMAEEEHSALHVTPLEAKFGIAVHGLNNHAAKTRALSAYMKQVGLFAPKFERIIERIAREANASNGKTLWPESMGLPENGAMAIYGVRHNDRPREIFVMDVEYKKDFIRFMRRTVEDMQYVEAGKKPKRAKVERSSVKGADQFKVTLQGRAAGQPILTVRFKDGVAALAYSTEVSKEERKAQRKQGSVLDHVAWSGSSMHPIFAKVSPGLDRLSVAFWARPAEMNPREQALAALESVSGIFVGDSSGTHFEANVTLDKSAEPFLAIAQPGPEGAKARQAMQDVAANGDLWARLSFSRAALVDLARELGGKGFEAELKEARQHLGFHPLKDVAERFTGDVLMSCHDGIADCVIAFGITKPSKAERAVKSILEAVSKTAGEVHFEHDRKAVIGGPKGAVMVTTHIFGQATNDRGRVDPKAARTDYAKVYWGVRPDLLLFGLTPHGVKNALKRTGSSEATWISPIAGEHSPPIGFDDKTTAAGFQNLTELSSLLRQVLAVARHTLPPKEWTGIFVRSMDAFIALYDRALSSTSTIRGDGLKWKLSARVYTLPGEGEKGYDAALDNAYKGALKARYEGRIRASNEALLALAEKSPKSPWGKKARAMVLNSGGLGLSTLPMLGAFGATAASAFERFMFRAKTKPLPMNMAP